MQRSFETSRKETERKQKQTMLRCRNYLSTNFIRKVSQCHYEVLKVKADCSHQEIRDSFVKLSKQLHPDGNEGNSKEFRKVMEAYKVLSKQDSRANYDYERSFDGKQINYGQFRDSNRSTKSNEYYGLRGVKKVANSKIVLLCAIWALIGIIVQVSLIRGSLTFRRKTLDEKSKEAGANHATARANAVKYGNEVQLERLKEMLERK